MRISLLDFQTAAVDDLLFHLEEAVRSVGRRPHARAVAFAAPTGAGKTVMMAAVIEAMLAGGEAAARAGIEPDPTLTFLWLSDRPDLNEQSRRRILNDANGLAPDRFVTIENNFDRETLAPGTIYFMNFQKLRSGSLLTRLGDERSNTIWETIAATQEQRPGKLIVVIDEAHRGLGNREQQEAQTIAAHFVRGGQGNLTVRSRPGEPDVAFPPVQIVVGVSATPERFNGYLTMEGGRTRVEIVVSPSDVRPSGLIKDRIVLVGPEDIPEGHLDVQWTLLDHAARKTCEVEAAWAEYAAEAPHSPRVLPVLVVQVEDATGNMPTATSLTTIVGTLREAWPTIRPDQIVHCFHGTTDQEPIPGWIIRYHEPTEIAEDPNIRIVLFKTALNTGWDCPRAEVMVSFRTLSQRPAIAQLVGRMVRTPLGRRVPGDATRNSTFLYLPNFDQAHLQQVKDYLTGEADEISSEVVSASEAQLLALREGAEEIYQLLWSLPTEVVAGPRPTTDVKRLLRFCRLLEQDGLDARATSTSVTALLELFEQDFAQRQRDAAFAARIRDGVDIRLASLSVEDGVITSQQSETTEVGAEDIDRAFRAASSVLADELGYGWLRSRFDDQDSTRAKLEFLELIQSPELMRRLQARASEQLSYLETQYLGQIQNLPEAQRDRYATLQRQGRSVQRAMMAPERRLFFPRPADATLQSGHLYVAPGTADECYLQLNEWERRVLAQERPRPDFVAFLRNLDRKRWSLSYSYELRGIAAAYPDFLIFRRDGNGAVVTDVLEPHQGEDSVAKARGMAAFAERYDGSFGRIQMIRDVAGNLSRLSFHLAEIRNLVLRQINSHADLLVAFEQHGTAE